MKYNRLTLKKGKEKFLHRKHPWIFSGAFTELPDQLEEHTVVEVFDSKGNFQAVGLYQKKSIALSVLSFSPIADIEEHIVLQIDAAIDYRINIGLIENPQLTNCMRLVFGEGDGLPGLIIDKYAETAVVQSHLQAWGQFLPLVADHLIGKAGIKQVYSKPTDKVDLEAGVLTGHSDISEVVEHGHKFNIDWAHGQKTGFFIDQRENRKRLGDFCKGKSVLNTFSYSGGFSVYALKAGATKAVSVDISESAIELANQNAELNGVGERHIGIASDVFVHLKEEGSTYDIIILDPPAFAKNQRATHNAVQAYKRLNLAAFKRIKPGGLVFTFSCSQHIGRQMFEDTIRAAAIESGRKLRLMERLGQPADHPQNIYHPEGEYLKGLILQVL